LAVVGGCGCWGAGGSTAELASTLRSMGLSGLWKAYVEDVEVAEPAEVVLAVWDELVEEVWEDVVEVVAEVDTLIVVDELEETVLVDVATLELVPEGKAPEGAP